MKKLQSILNSIGKSPAAFTNQIFAAYDDKNYQKAYELASTLSANQVLTQTKRNGMSLIYQSVADCNAEALKVFSGLEYFREVIT